MLADSIPAAHSSPHGDVGTSRLEEQLQIQTKRSHAHPKEASYLHGRGTMPPKPVTQMSVMGQKATSPQHSGMSALLPIVLQNSFCGMGLKFSEPQVRRLNNDVGDHVVMRQTNRRFW